MADARGWLALPLVAMLAACGGDGPAAPGAETVGEVRALDDAAEMLAQQRAPTPAPGVPETE